MGKLEDFLKHMAYDPCKITLEKTATGAFHSEATGSRIAILLTLATAEIQLKEKLKCDDKEYELILNISKDLSKYVKS